MSGRDLQPVRSGATGRIIPCCWGECDRPGYERFAIRVHESPQRTTIYLFCSARHRAYYANGHVEYGQLPSGSKSTDGHVSVPAQRRWKEPRT